MIFPHETLAQLQARVERIAPHEGDLLQAMWVRPSLLAEILARHGEEQCSSPRSGSRSPDRSEVTALRAEIREERNARTFAEAQVKRLTAELASALGEVKRLRKQAVGSVAS